MSVGTVAAHRTRALALAAGLALLGTQPCGPIPGDALEGPVAGEPVDDWSFADAHPRCRLEVNPAAPRSVTVYCIPSGEVLYVPAIMGESKRWTRLAVADPRGRIQIGGTIYPVSLTRVEDAAERLAAARAGHWKYQGEAPPADLEVPEGHWYFRLRSRQP